LNRIQLMKPTYSIVEMNVGIIVACGTCNPTFYNHTKITLAHASVSLRSLFASNRSGDTVADQTGQSQKNYTGERINSQVELKQITPSINSIRNAETA
jgi:hypothetical protein